MKKYILILALIAFIWTPTLAQIQVDGINRDPSGGTDVTFEGTTTHENAGNTIWKLDPTDIDPDAPFFFMEQDTSPNATAERDNYVISWGINYKAGGLRGDNSEPAVYIQLENFYENAGVEYVEAHIGTLSENFGTDNRLISCQAGRNEEADSYICGVSADVFKLLQPARNGVAVDQKVKFDLANETIHLNDNTFIRGSTNNVAILQQQNVGITAAYDLIYLDSTDDFILGDSGSTGYIEPQRPMTADVDLHTVADSGDGSPASYTLNPDGNLIGLTCNDTDGCDITMGETVTKVRRAMIINLSANVCNFADTAGVSELAGAFAAGQNDVIDVLYTGATWVEISRSNN